MRFSKANRALDLTLPALRVKGEHERWLSRALAIGEEAFPHIPVRRVDDGGFSNLLDSPGGAERAAQWWFEAFETLEELDLE